MAKAKKAETTEIDAKREFGTNIGRDLIEMYKKASPRKQLKRLSKDYRRAREGTIDPDASPEMKAMDYALLAVLHPRIRKLMAKVLLKEATRAFRV